MAAVTTLTTTHGESLGLPPPTGQAELKPAPVYDVYKLSDERTHILRKLLEKGHVTVAPLRNPELILHSHLPHVGAHEMDGASPSDLFCSYLDQHMAWEQMESS